MVEQRESIRVAAPEGSVVVNQLNQVKVGRIVDISVSGFLLAGHGLYSWGNSIAATKRHIEVFEFLFECFYNIHLFTSIRNTANNGYFTHS